jgi:hypothetical protein
MFPHSQIAEMIVESRTAEAARQRTIRAGVRRRRTSRRHILRRLAAGPAGLLTKPSGPRIQPL